jgi:hypothetical protein
MSTSTSKFYPKTKRFKVIKPKCLQYNCLGKVDSTSLQQKRCHFLNKEILNNDNDVIRVVEEFLQSKEENLFSKAIDRLPGRWVKGILGRIGSDCQWIMLSYLTMKETFDFWLIFYFGSNLVIS